MKELAIMENQEFVEPLQILLIGCISVFYQVLVNQLIYLLLNDEDF